MWATASLLPSRATQHQSAERGRIEHRPDLVANFPARRLLGGQIGIAPLLLILTRVERADRAGDDEERDAGPEPGVAGLHDGHERRDGSTKRAREQRSRLLE